MKIGFKPLLAGTVEPEDIDKLMFPLYASPKLDGIRAMVVDGKLVSRNMKLIPNAHVQKLYGKAKYNNLDGELLIEGDMGSPTAFRDTSSAVMSRDGKPDVTFYVFDTFQNPNDRFSRRFGNLTARALELSEAHISVVPHATINTVADLLKYEEVWLKAGLEGVMLRSLIGTYKFGRSTFNEGILLKLKRFKDGEAEIIGAEEQMHNANTAKKDALGRTERSSHRAGLVGKGMLGAFVVRDLETKAEFNVGTGYSDLERAGLWQIWIQEPRKLLGRVVKYRYFPTGFKDLPRFPTYEGFRHPVDL